MNFYALRQRINKIRYRYLEKSLNASTLTYGSYLLRRNEMEQSALHSEYSGISTESICEKEIIISLTTFGARYYDVYLAIESIMQGTVKPNRIILWVSDELKNCPIPITLQKQIKRGLEIRYVKDLRSYTKLYYALKEFPDSNIITVDDDIIYPHDTVENLLNAHNLHKDYICANDYLIIPPDFKKSNRPMMDWDRPKKHLLISDRCIFEGFAGVLYPPHSLSEEVFDKDSFLNICTTSDDVWFSSMALLNGTKCIYACPNMDGFRLVSNYAVQGVALSNNNTRLNQINIHNVFKKYSLY